MGLYTHTHTHGNLIKEKINVFNNKGITLVSLVITIILILIVSSTTINVSYKRFEINSFNKMKNDLELLADKVSNYYLQTGNIPVVLDSSGNKAQYTFTTLDFDKDSADNSVYYILDLEAMDGLLLNYGKSGFENLNTSEDVYVINEQSHVVYYVKGIKLNGKLYHYIKGNEQDNSVIPPTTPQVKVINGELRTNSDGTTYYWGAVTLEFVPGISGSTQISKTTYSINNGTETDISTLTNNLYKLNDTTAEYSITLKTYGTNGKVSTSNNVIKTKGAIGSYVQYNVPYTDMYSGINYTDDNGWRYLGKDDNGNYLIVSTGIPVILYFSFGNKIGNVADGGTNTWWATKTEISSENTPEIYRTDKGYDYNTDNGEPSKYAAYGLRYKFESILFNYSASEINASTANKGIYRKVGTQTNGELSKTAFRASGVNIIDVHNLTLAELNRATNIVSGSKRKDSELEESGFKDLIGTALGLFDMNKLTNYTQNYYYWISSPESRTKISTEDRRKYLNNVNYTNNYIGFHNNASRRSSTCNYCFI